MSSQPPILVVDENDNPDGKASMKEALEKNHFRRLVRLMIQNSKGQLLLQKRSENEFAYPGRWDNSAAGHVDYGETNEQALKRETFEEIGVSDFNYEKIGHYYNELHSGKYKIRKFNHVYSAFQEATPTNLSEEEVAEVRWFDIADIKKMITDRPDDFTDGAIEVIKRYY